MNLRISINANHIAGPYGGGNQFASTLEAYLRSRGHEVFRTLAPGLDLILILAAQRELRITAYHVEAIADYISLNPNTVVVHRVNTCDEQRGANLGINQAVLQANRLADVTVFVSAFIRDLFLGQGLDAAKPHGVILNAADEQIFHPTGRAEWRPGQKLKIVTHHWSANYMKGFDIYERLDQLLAIPPFKDLFEFTYIGNTPLGVTFHNTHVRAPLHGLALAEALKQHHFYVTAARHEPGGNHYIEAMRCGLPVLCLRTGSLPEYCAPYGLEFTLADFEARLLEMRERYSELRERVLECPYAGNWMAAQYESLFMRLVAERRAASRPQPGFWPRLRRTARVARKRLGRLRRAFFTRLAG